MFVLSEAPYGEGRIAMMVILIFIREGDLLKETGN
jgi:hypothetical protein